MTTRPTLRALVLAAACVLAATGAGDGAAAGADAGAGALRARHDALHEAMASSHFGRPIVVDSGPSTGEVWAIVEQPYAVVGSALRDRRSWCDLLVLPFNVKHCASDGDGIALVVGRKAEQALEDAYRIDFSFASQHTPDLLRVKMAADTGPVGTKDYRLLFEATPIDARRTFVHLSYSYGYGMAASMATKAYLATAGRSKVGFTITGRTPQGEPVYVDGMRGIAERNAMRYYLAVEAFLASQAAAPAQRQEKRLRDWFDATERYARQLHEMDRDAYLTLKRAELQAMQ